MTVKLLNSQMPPLMLYNTHAWMRSMAWTSEILGTIAIKRNGKAAEVLREVAKRAVSRKRQPSSKSPLSP
jgi:hypothetical protein